jgi:hypothetical protein
MVKLAVSGEFEDKIETKTSSKAKANSSDITLQKAVDMGEYDPKYLANFSQWYQMTRIMQWQYIRQAIKNRHRFLMIQWAELNNQLDFSQKPYLKTALKNIENQLDKLQKDEEKYQVEYSI